MLTRLREAHLKLHPKKCQFFRKCVAFLGHVISSDGVSTDPAKISSIVHWPTPTNVSELRSFLGLASYYRRFILKFADVAAPLHRLQEKAVSFQWSEQCNSAFETLKRRLSSAPVLAFPRSSDTFILDTDASEHGIGAVLSQNQCGIERVIAYGSRTLTKSERNYCVTRRELLALVYFLRHFRSYLLGRPFVVRTDHAALRWIQQFKEPEGQIARWLEHLQEFNFQTEYRPGKCHGNADALSRVQCNQCGMCHSFSTTTTSAPSYVSPPNHSSVYSVNQAVDCWASILSNQELQEKQNTDPVLGIILVLMSKGPDRPPEGAVAGTGQAVHSLWAQWNRLEIINNLLYRRWEETDNEVIKRQLVVPRALVPEVIRAAHNLPGGGHLGVHKTLAKVRDRFYWPGLREDIEDWCRCCQDCAESKSPSSTARGPLIPSRVGYPMQRVALDLFGPLPVTRRGNKYILVVTDYFTRWVEAYSLPNQEAATVARVLVNEWVSRYGAPDVIHSDQGKNFDSQLFKGMCQLLGIHKTRTTPYHPQSDGLVERFNRTLKTLLRIQMKQVPEDMWDEELPLLMLAYRSSVQESTRFTPYRLMFGREVRLPVELMFGGTPAPGETHTDYVTHLRERLEGAYRVVRENLHGAVQHQKQHYDRKTTGGRYQVGDPVWLYSPAVSRGQTAKFHRPWKGPYRVVKVLSDVTYRIQLMSPRNRRDRRRNYRVIVHFNRLKPCHLQENLHQLPTPEPQTEISDDEIGSWVWYQQEPSPTPDQQSVPSESGQGSELHDHGREEVTTRGGPVWGSRLRRTVQRPNYYQPDTTSASQRRE